MKTATNQASLFGYYHPVTGDVTSHPPLCACGQCGIPAVDLTNAPQEAPTQEPGGLTVYLVSCVAEKRTQACAARDLYCSDWFKKARAYVESTGCRWQILSACFSVLNPDTVIEPYNYSLIQDESAADRRLRSQTWGRATAGVLALEHFKGTKFVIFAGSVYREFLAPELLRLGFKVEVPLQGLGIGQQKKWFMEHTEGR